MSDSEDLAGMSTQRVTLWVEDAAGERQPVPIATRLNSDGSITVQGLDYGTPYHVRLAQGVTDDPSHVG